MTQLELLLNKCRDASPEEVKEWEQTDYFRKGNFDVMKMFVLVPTLIQIGAVLFMFGVMYLNQHLF